MPCFIAIAGTHSTGKTTFMDTVQTALGGHGVVSVRVSDKATDCRDAGFGILRDHTFESTLWIMSSVIRGELEAGLKADVVLVDRPVPDALGYLEAALETQARVISAEERAYLYDLARHHSQRYALLLKTRLDQDIPLGPDRDPDTQFRALVDVKIDEALAVAKVKHTVLEPAQVEAVVEEVLRIVQSGSRPS